MEEADRGPNTLRVRDHARKIAEAPLAPAAWGQASGRAQPHCGRGALSLYTQCMQHMQHMRHMRHMQHMQHMHTNAAESQSVAVDDEHGW